MHRILCLLMILPGLAGWAQEIIPVGDSTPAAVRFQVLSPTLVRMEYAPSGAFTDAPSVVVMRREWPSVSYTKSTEDGWFRLDTGSMVLHYQLGSGAFTADTLHITWKDANGEHIWHAGDADTENLGGIGLDADMWKRNRTGQASEFPGLISRKGCTLFDDSQTAIWDADAQWVKDRPDTQGVDWFFFLYGNDYKRMFQEYIQLTGPSPMVPRYIMGTTIASRHGYSGHEWKLIIDQFREKNIPLDVLMMDSVSSAKKVWSGGDWDLEQIPDPVGFMRDMKERGIHVSKIMHYGIFSDWVADKLISSDDSQFENIRKAVGFPEGITGLDLDVSNKQQAQAFIDYMVKPSLDMGMAFWWMDGCPIVTMQGLRQHDGLGSLMWARHLQYTASEQITGRRTFVLCRHGGPGSHRYPGHFTGDVSPQWSTLEYLVPHTVRAGNSMEPFISNEWFMYPNLDPEMYARVVQFLSFTPVTHLLGILGMRMPWEYGPQGEEQCKTFFGLRYKLLPYLYTLTRETHETGLPIVRGMYLNYPEQNESYTYMGQYMMGEHLLLAPVTRPGYGEPVLQTLYLPQGARWYDYFTGAIYEGGQVLDYDCPLERMPLFVRAGAIIPMAPPMNWSDERPLDPLILDVYASDNGAVGQLYEDDGISLEYRNNQFAWTRVEMRPMDGQVGDYSLVIHPTEGQFPGQPAERRYLIQIHGLLKPSEITQDGQPLPQISTAFDGKGWMWDSMRKVLAIQLTNAMPIAQEVRLQLTGAGTSADVMQAQQLGEFLERIRRTKHEFNLKYVMLSELWEHAKPPRFFRESEAIEEEISNYLARPQDWKGQPLDHRAMANHILAAMENQPFESNRILPHPSQQSQEVSKKLEFAECSPLELERAKSLLLGLNVRALVIEDHPEVFTTGPYLHIKAKLDYDAAAVPEDAKVILELQCPEEGMPGYAIHLPVLEPDGWTRFDVRYPNEPAPGSHIFKVRATLTWQNQHIETWKDVRWMH